MKYAFLLFLLAFSSLIFAANCEKNFESIKQEIATCHEQLKKELSANEISDIHYRLAQAYFQDQQIDKAFNHFLEALEEVPTKEEKLLPFAEGEKKYFEDAFALYLSLTGSEPEAGSKKLLENFEKIGTQHPEYFHLNFLLASSYGNLGMYDLFFSCFYPSYPYLSTSYLAHKTKGILLLRLAQHNPSLTDRRKQQQQAFAEIQNALEKNPKDPSLYKILVFLAKEVENDTAMAHFLQKMVDEQVQIQRSDLCCFVQEAIFLEKLVLAQELIDLAKKYYPSSRSVLSVQEYLDHKR